MRLSDDSRYRPGRVARTGRRKFIGSAAMGSAALALAACGGGSNETKDGSPAASGSGSTALATAAAKKEPQRGGTFTFSIGGDPPNLDMQANSTYQVNWPMSPIFNQLVRFDPDVPLETTKSIVGDLAKSWEQSADGLQLTFKLNEGVTFHDGKPFGSADVKASLERVANPPKGVGSPRRDQLAPIDKIETPDAATVVLKLKRPSSALMLILAQGWMSIYSAADMAAEFDFKTKTNGTGPYKLKDWLRGNRLTYEPNPNYFVKGVPYVKGMTCYIIPDDGTRVAQFQAGELLFDSRFLPSNLKSLESTLGKKITVQRTPSIGFNTLNFGPKAPWRDERVRRAVSLVIDRQDAIALLVEGEGDVGTYMTAKGAWALSEQELKEIPGYGPYSDKAVADAKALLSAAGVQPGHETTLLTRQGADFERLTLLVIDSLKKIGINGKPRVLETASSYPDLDNRNFDLAPWAHATALDDPDAIYPEFYLTKSPRNYSDIGSAEVDDLFTKQGLTLDPAERLKIVKQMDMKAAALYSKVILNWTTRRWAWWNSVQNYTAHIGIYNNMRFAEVWLEQR